MNRTFNVITKIILIILTVFTLLFTFIGVGELLDGMESYDLSEDSFLYSLEDGRYSDLVEYYHRNEAIGTKTTDTMEECYAIARYYEAAVDYQLALQAGDSLKKTSALERMNTAASEMGELSFAKAEIDSLWGVK